MRPRRRHPFFSRPQPRLPSLRLAGLAYKRVRGQTGETPRTMTDEWAKATAAKRSGKALEAGEAVIMDPISRYAYGSK